MLFYQISLVIFTSILSIVYSAKITLFDSTKLKDDLNWSKLSFKETPNSIQTSNNWVNDRLNSFASKNDLHGWKESSFSQSGGDDVWRIHFVCDLNIQNIQNWLFTPLINTKTANRVTLNLTFTIRECEHFPINQVVKNCREKFELYYEETQSLNEQNKYSIDDSLTNDQNRTSVYLLNKIKQLRFRDTFVSDTGLRYYNSVVDRKKQLNYNSNRPGESMINVELREIPITDTSTDTYIRFAIRDTGACISLLAVEVSYVTCSSFTRHGIYFPETPTGKDLTDLVQVNGKCPEFSLNTQQPKAICTARGEWLITDSNLSNRCLCTPGYEFNQDKCTPCPVGYFKSSTSNELKCELCPENSWSSQPGSGKCECLTGYYKENDSDYSSPCKQIQQINADHINLEFLNDEKINISLNRVMADKPLDSKIKTDFRCFQCDNNNLANSYCEVNCFILGAANDWIMILNRNLNQNSKLKLIIRQKLNDKELSQTSLFIYLKQEKHDNNKNKISCELSQNIIGDLRKGLCVNMSLNLPSEFESLFPRIDLVNKIKQNGLLNMNIYSLMINNDYQLIPLNSQSLLQTTTSRSTYIKLNPVDDLKSKLLNRTVQLQILHCNPNQIDKIKLQLELQQLNEQKFLNLLTKDILEVYTIDLRINDLCSLREVKKSPSLPQLITNHALIRSKDSFSSTSNMQQINSNQNGSNIKLNIIIPILLSLLLVSSLLILIIYVRKTRFNFSSSKQFSCEKNLNKFIPVLSRKCSSKCKNCSNSNTSSCSSTTSSSPSTMCTTSQIIGRESKLYYVDPHTYEDPTLAVQEFAQEISPLDIKIESVIGGGEFGDVCKGKLKTEKNIWVTVAIKTLKVGSSEKNRCDFLTEASIMAQFHHENIICLEGVVTQSNPLMIITEYMDNGSLDTFLRLNSWRLNIYDMIKMLRDIANGMKYLSEMNFVHRDLAARNILVDKDLNCKVADFGLSREIEGTNTEGVYWTKGGKIPVRWTAPEAITHTKFTCSSDVWSYGVVMWEVMSFGERPYWNWSNTDVIKAVEKGFRLFIPPNCPKILYNMMLECWDADRLKRPKFKKIVNDLEMMTKSKKECLYVSCKNIKQNSFIDTNRPNFTHLTSIHEWLNSLNLLEYLNLFLNNKYLNLSQALSLDLEDLIKIGIYDQTHQMMIIESIKRIQFELNFQNGFLV